MPLPRSSPRGMTAVPNEKRDSAVSSVASQRRVVERNSTIDEVITEVEQKFQTDEDEDEEGFAAQGSMTNWANIYAEQGDLGQRHRRHRMRLKDGER